MPDLQVHPQPNEIEVSVFGPGFGECILVHLGHGEWLLVDSCIDQEVGDQPALRYLEGLGLDPAIAVKIILATHWHMDHVRGLAEVVRRCLGAQFFCSLALAEGEARTFYAASAPGSHRTAAREFYDVFALLEDRAPPGRVKAIPPIRWAAEEKRLYHRPKSEGEDLDAEVVALSPSDAAVTLALQAFRDLVPGVGDSLREAIWQGPNHNAVVLWVRVGTGVTVLGADLEEQNNPQLGWAAIIAAFTREAATMLKVPHHGSNTGHHPEIWTKLLKPAPIAVLSPFALGSVELPTPADRDRILTQTTRAYITAQRARYSPTPIDRVVDKTLSETTVKHYELNRRMGQVRLRRGASAEAETDWEVDLFGAAEPLRRH